jgi:hypothetical protein
LQPVLLSSVMESGHHAVINATNPALVDGDATVPQDTLNVRRTVLVADCLYYRVRVRSFHPQPVATVVEVLLAADFADVFEVRGVGRRTGGRLSPPTRDGDRLRFVYVAVDGQRRETLVELSPSPLRVRIDEDRVQVAWDVRLDAGEAIEMQLTVFPVPRGRRRARPTLEQTAARLEATHADWVGGGARSKLLKLRRTYTPPGPLSTQRQRDHQPPWSPAARHPRAHAGINASPRLSPAHAAPPTGSAAPHRIEAPTGRLVPEHDPGGRWRYSVVAVHGGADQRARPTRRGHDSIMRARLGW